MLTNFPKLADKNFVIGFLLPVLIAGVAGIFMFGNTGPAKAIRNGILEDATFTDLTLVAISTWAMSVLLLLFNYHIYRLLEGYEGPLHYLPGRMKRQRLRFDQLLEKLKSDYDIIHAKNLAVTETLKANYLRHRRIRNEMFPQNRRDLLTSRFGNVIRAFEAYSYNVYGVDSIPAWLRLQALIPKNFLSVIDDARAQVDFFVNGLVLALLIGGAAAVHFMSNIYIVAYCAQTNIYAMDYCAGHDWFHVHFRWDLIIWIVLALCVARGCYELAIDRAIAWGGLVKSAFDLYLPKLARQLGHALPDLYDARQAFWDTVNSQFLYGVAIPDERPRIGTGDDPIQPAGQQNETVEPDC
jgi:hypothetical protein